MKPTPHSGVSSTSGSLEWLGEKAASLEADYKRACGRIDEEEAALVECVAHELACAEAAAIIQVAAQQVQEQAHAKIAGMVSRCLAAVFREPYEFRIEFERKRGRTEAKMTFFRDGMEVHPTMGAGWGVVEVASLALRVAALMLTKPAPRKILFLDEPLKAVGAGGGNKRRVAELLRTLSDELQIQILMITHDATFEVGKVVRIRRESDEVLE